MTEDEPPHRSAASEGDIMAGDRRLSRADASLPDWEVPDTAYRPVPIVWFTAALFAQQIALLLVLALLPPDRNRLALMLAAMASAMIGKWTWTRGMATAPRGWQCVTAVMLAGQFALAALVFAARE